MSSIAHNSRFGVLGHYGRPPRQLMAGNAAGWVSKVPFNPLLLPVHHRMYRPANYMFAESHQTSRQGRPAQAQCLRSLTTIDPSQGEAMALEHGCDGTLMIADKSIDCRLCRCNTPRGSCNHWKSAKRNDPDMLISMGDETAP